MSPARSRPKLAVWKFASCDGCQLSLLDCEDELIAIAKRLEIAYFLEATSTRVRGPYALSLVEGSITTSHDAERIHKIRRQSQRLVTIGACATAGGIQALRNFASVEDYARSVYPRPELLQTLAQSTPIHEHVRVDFELRGCPISKHQLIEVVGAFLTGRRPNIPRYSECVECKREGHGLRHGRPRRSLPRPGDAGRVRQPVPAARARLLWLLRADGGTQHGEPRRLVRAARHERSGSARRLPQLQRRRGPLPEGERGP